MQVTIDYCTNCRIFLGPCDGSVRPSHARVRARRCMEACDAWRLAEQVFIRNCNGCTVTLATKQVWT